MAPPTGSMNTGHTNSQGRTIYRGPRGGEFVLGAGGRVIRNFKKAGGAAAPAPARSALNNAKAHMNTLKTFNNRKAYLRSRAVNMTNANWIELSRYKNNLNFRARIRAPNVKIGKKLAKMIMINNNTYVSTWGGVYNRRATLKHITPLQLNALQTRAFNINPKHLVRHMIPLMPHGRPNEAFMKKHKLKNSTLIRAGRTSNGNSNGVQKKLYFNKHGYLYYIRLNGKKLSVTDPHVHQYRIEPNSKNLRNLTRLTGLVNPNYPRMAIPPASPEVRRTSPELVNNILDQIYPPNGAIGRGRNVNATRYTNAEKNVIARRLTGSIQYFKEHRNAKKAEAEQRRAGLRVPGLTNAQKQTLRNQAAAANERVGYYDDAVRAYTRGLRAVKPLTGVVTPRARAMPNTPNRHTPAPANVEENAIYMPLNRPHLVAKVPGAATIYLNPNTFAGYIKNSVRVNLAPANVRNWLRMARRNFPNEPLFRHPLVAKNVTARHIRFSRA